MKLQLIEKITIRKAHRERMRCAHCGGSMYQIHHVFYPNLEEQWYISCGICGNATDNYWFKKNALRKWKEEIMLTMFTALEARATAYLLTPKDYSLYTHIEIRILDSVQHGGTHILYAGEITNNVIMALRALGYEITILKFEGEEKMIRIDWTNIMCPDSLVCPKEVNSR